MATSEWTFLSFFVLLSPAKAELALNRFIVMHSNSFKVSDGNKHLQKTTDSHPRRKTAVNFSQCWWTLENRLKKVLRTQTGVCPTNFFCIKSLIVFTRACIKMSYKQFWKQRTRNWWKIKLNVTVGALRTVEMKGNVSFIAPHLF